MRTSLLIWANAQTALVSTGSTAMATTNQPTADGPMLKLKATIEETTAESHSTMKQRPFRNGWSSINLTAQLFTKGFLQAGMKSAPLSCQKDQRSQHNSIDLSAGAAYKLGVPLDGIATVRIAY